MANKAVVDGRESKLWFRSSTILKLLFVLAASLLLFPVLAELRLPLTFDDAFMFWRYAVHVRDGLGMAWNPDGIPTYGLTSQLWVWWILPFTATSLTPDLSLKLASMVTGLAGMGAIPWAAWIGRGKPAAQVAGILALLLLVIGPFSYHLTTGMDTMLSFLTNIALIAAALAWRHGAFRSTLLVGLAAFVTILARPENVLVAFGVPLLMWLLVLPQRRFGDILTALGIPAALLIVDLTVSHFVYGTVLPLSFYAKSGASYAGFINRETPLRYFAISLPAALPALTLLTAFGRSRALLVLAMTLPVVATFLYLVTVRQVMGFEGRYFIPFLPFILIPAAIAAADNCSQRARVALPLGLLCSALLILQLGQPLVERANSAWLRMRLPTPITAPQPATRAAAPLPKLPPGEAWAIVANRIVARLPAHTVIAASEVGMAGAAAPDVTVIDLAGLNDQEIGLQGFSAVHLVRRAPALIWLPHDDYTGARAALLGDAEFRRHYRLIAGAFDYGVAIRLDAPDRRQIERIVVRAWHETYPGSDIGDYIAQWPRLNR